MSKFSDKDTGLAFDLQIGPVGDQVWGYYSRVQNLPKHFMITWEELMVTKFFMIPTHLFHPKAGPLQTRYVALQKASNTAHYKKDHLSLQQHA